MGILMLAGLLVIGVIVIIALILNVHKKRNGYQGMNYGNNQNYHQGQSMNGQNYSAGHNKMPQKRKAIIEKYSGATEIPADVEWNITKKAMAVGFVWVSVVFFSACLIFSCLLLRMFHNGIIPVGVIVEIISVILVLTGLAKYNNAQDIKTVIKSFVLIGIGTVISIGTAWIPGSGYFVYKSCVKKGIEKYKKSLSK